MSKPILLEVIAPILDRVGLCSSCQVVMGGVGLGPAGQEQSDYPEEHRRDFEATLTLVKEAAETFGDGLVIRWYDPRSLRGLWLSIRHGVRRYPTFVLKGGEKIVGLDGARVQLLRRLDER